MSLYLVICSVLTAPRARDSAVNELGDQTAHQQWVYNISSASRRVKKAGGTECDGADVAAS